MRISLLPTLLRETLGPRSLQRVTEPEVMNDPARVEAYTDSGRHDGPMDVVYLLNAAHATQALANKRRVLDLACGPATQLVQIARLNPNTEFIGLDLSEPMLQQARAYVKKAGVTNVTFKVCDITKLEFEDASIDGIVSTLALHHLPSLEHLKKTFAEIRRVLKPDGALFLADFCRFRSEKTVKYFVKMRHQNPLMTEEFDASLRAAFSVDDFQAVCHETFPNRVSFHSTFGIAFLGFVSTDALPLGEAVKRELKAQREQLPGIFKEDLDELRLYLRMAGVRPDPFD